MTYYYAIHHSYYINRGASGSGPMAAGSQISE